METGQLSKKKNKKKHNCVFNLEEMDKISEC